MNVDEMKQLLINPIYAISIHPDLEGQHEPIISKAQWIEANLILVDEVGLEEWLERLLTLLEGDFPRNPHDPTNADGYLAKA